MMRDLALERAAEAARLVLGGPVDSVERARGFGRNSAVYRVRQGGASYALKQYPPRRPGERDRAVIELAALRFMTAHGIDSVPRPFAADPERGCALLEWIDGAAMTTPDAGDIAAAAGFLARVHGLRAEHDARALPPAAEACLSGDEITAQIERRLARLGALAADEPALATFLDDAFRPLVVRIARWAEAGYAEKGLSFTRPVDIAAQTLCASDFGFHNALRRPSGELVFIDFDDFGWDDPVKLTADFLLHPGMQLSASLKRQFAAAATAIYQADETFAARLQLLYPLFALRWCLILLNEFLPERWTHRINAGAQADWVAAKQRQLDRVRDWVQSLATNFQRFPHGP
jgi:phosphotransferase family enzyme